MAKYNLIGRRYLRKYTASRTSPVYASIAEAQKIANSLCSVPWTRVNARSAGMSYHTNAVINPDADGHGTTGLDMNVEIRDELDAAMFCAGHVGDQHRAYANAAVYVYTLPDAAVGKSLAALTANVTTDPYNEKGCRLHVWTSDALEIPTSCADVRGDGADGTPLADGTVAAAVAPRTVKTVVTGYSKSGAEVTTDYWYPATKAETLAPTGGLTLKKYLFLAVVLESYSTTRGNWVEGCSYIDNSVSVELSDAVDGWTAGKTYDLSEPAETEGFAVLKGGVAPSVKRGDCTGERSVAVRADANLVVEADGAQAAARKAPGANAANAVSRLYAEFFTKADVPPTADEPAAQTGVAFNVTRVKERHLSADSDVPVTTDTLRIDSRVLVVPLVMPQGFSGQTLRVEYETPSFTPGTSVRCFVLSGVYATSLDAPTLQNPALYDGKPGSSLNSLGALDLSATHTDLPLPATNARFHTLVFSAFLPPDAVDVASTEPQGTGAAPFMPTLTVIE